MKKMALEQRKITTSRLIMGCMGLGGGWNNNPITEEDILQGERVVDAALASGITMFDHADIYTFGKAEKVFGEVLKRRPELREKIVLQSKCGIRFPEGELPNRYDFSTEHILNSVDGILARLGVEYIDILLLHRPDPLMEPDEVADTFEILEKSGKVRHFGVSNMNVPQMKLLQKYCTVPIVVNQLELNLQKLDWLEQGVLVNQEKGTNFNFSEGIIEHCLLENIQIQAWSPLAKGIYSGREMENPTEAYMKTKLLVEQMATKNNTTLEAIVLGWLMRHPAMIQPVIGSVNLERIKNCQDAISQSKLMTRDEWYSLYVASRGQLMP
ncbi:aldo/keto reductase [Bacillaceae bacterium IKA-2]|nr:aldo/keto reductase [Bacillaceae bacterium IKA-2]